MSLLLSIVAASPRRTSVTIDDWFKQSDATNNWLYLSRTLEEPIITADQTISEAKYFRFLIDEFVVVDELLQKAVRTVTTIEQLSYTEEFVATYVTGGTTINDVVIDEAITFDELVEALAQYSRQLEDSIAAIVIEESSFAYAKFNRLIEDPVDLLDDLIKSTVTPGSTIYSIAS